MRKLKRAMVAAVAIALIVVNADMENVLAVGTATDNLRHWTTISEPEQNRAAGDVITPEEPTVTSTIAPSKAPTKIPKMIQIITAKNFTKTYGSKAFKIGAKTNGNGKLTYKSNNKKIVTVSSSGMVSIKGCGKTTITIKASKTSKYEAAQKKITIIVKPQKQKIVSLDSIEVQTITVKWQKDTKATGYIIQYSTDKKFKKNVEKITISNNKTTSKKISKLKDNETYYVRVCSYKESSKEKIQGSYSVAKSAKVKSDFQVENGVLVEYVGNGGDIVIPDGITAINESVFWENESVITSVKIPSSVKSIGDMAFYDCNSLKKVEISAGLKSIGDSTFEDCISLSSIKIPDSVTRIGEFAFSGCSSLRSMEIPSGVTSIEYCTFAYCSSMSSIKIPKGVKSIGMEAFSECESLDNVIIPNSVTSIGESAFSGCSNLKTMELPISVTEIGNGTFSGCSSLSNIVIPFSVINIGAFAFDGCSSLGSIRISGNVSNIGWYAFHNCDVMLFCVRDSYAEAYARENSIAYQYWDGILTQTITAQNVTKTYGSKAFSLKAETNGNGKLTYTTSNKKVVTVSHSGKVTIKGYGKATITIKAAATAGYKAATKKVTITVKPKKAVISSVKSLKEKSITIKWKKDTKASGYILQYSTDKRFKKNVKKVTISSNKTISKEISKLKAGKTYYVRVCSYMKSSGEKIQGSYSKAKSVKVK
ncbi:MAG: leucine-rich repeat protein [Lachnospiraceae bacterium]|nr:leucine-rich repeat protein [Lachnospiraceae bacterium]